MEKYEFKEIRPNFYAIEMGFVRSFMVVGTDEILLIDTGVGGNELKKQVEAVADLPIKVIFTHGDGDHVGDVDEFARRMMYPGEYDYYQSRNENYAPMTPIFDGDIIPIGNYMFEVLVIPGHTPGSIALLEREHRLLIGGDSIQKGPIFMFGPGRNFDALHDSMIRLEDYQDAIDVIYACHHDLENSPETITKVKEAVEIIKTGTVEGIPQERFNNQASLYDTGEISFFAK